MLGTAGAWTNGEIVGATGSVQVVSNNGATFYITGVQLEKGSTATSFDYRPYGTELQLCQRYCINYNTANNSNNYGRFGIGTNSSTTVLTFVTNPFVPMRTAPSLTTTGTASDYLVQYGTGGSTSACTSIPSLNDANENHATINFTCSAVLTVGSGAQGMANNNKTAYLLLTAEL
jgi:hypothetical protein